MLPRALKQVDALSLNVGDRVCLGPPTLEAIVSSLWCFNNTVYVVWKDPKCHALIQSQFYSTATLFVYEKTKDESNGQNPA